MTVASAILHRICQHLINREADAYGDMAEQAAYEAATRYLEDDPDYSTTLRREFNALRDAIKIIRIKLILDRARNRS